MYTLCVIAGRLCQKLPLAAEERWAPCLVQVGHNDLIGLSSAATTQIIKLKLPVKTLSHGTFSEIFVRKGVNALIIWARATRISPNLYHVSHFQILFHCNGYEQSPIIWNQKVFHPELNLRSGLCNYLEDTLQERCLLVRNEISFNAFLQHRSTSWAWQVN